MAKKRFVFSKNKQYDYLPLIEACFLIGISSQNVLKYKEYVKHLLHYSTCRQRKRVENPDGSVKNFVQKFKKFRYYVHKDDVQKLKEVMDARPVRRRRAILPPIEDPVLGVLWNCPYLATKIPFGPRLIRDTVIKLGMNHYNTWDIQLITLATISRYLHDKQHKYNFFFKEEDGLRLIEHFRKKRNPGMYTFKEIHSMVNVTVYQLRGFLSKVATPTKIEGSRLNYYTRTDLERVLLLAHSKGHQLGAHNRYAKRRTEVQASADRRRQQYLENFGEFGRGGRDAPIKAGSIPKKRKIRQRISA